MHWYLQLMDRLIAAVGFLVALVYVTLNGLTGWVNRIPPKSREKIIRSITRGCLFLGLIILFFRPGNPVGSWMLLVAWTGFLAEWVVGKVEAAETRRAEMADEAASHETAAGEGGR